MERDILLASPHATCQTQLTHPRATFANHRAMVRTNEVARQADLTAAQKAAAAQRRAHCLAGIRKTAQPLPSHELPQVKVSCARAAKRD